jgi:energy-coupling factor transport system ATP-binding protein
VRETTFITGSNGSGKTTLAKLMAGILKPLSGEVSIMGTSSSQLKLGEVGKRVGYLWQNPRQQLFARSVLEELTFVEELKNPKMTKAEKDAVYENAIDMLEYFDLAQLKDKNCYYLSHGERQRLALAAVITSGACYLVLDEPTKGLDSKRKESLSNLLESLRYNKKVGLCIISHDEKFVGGLMERTVAVDAGRVTDG